MRLQRLHDHELIFKYFNITFILHFDFYRNLANEFFWGELFVLNTELHKVKLHSMGVSTHRMC